MAYIEKPDLEFCQNNDVLVVCYGDKGRLAHLKRYAGNLHGSTCDVKFKNANPASYDYRPKVWAFIDYARQPYWWHVRGVCVGSVSEGRAFLERCRQAGITSCHRTMDVPFSNGQKLEFATTNYRSKEGHPEARVDFTWEELVMADVNLPTVEELVAELKNPATP